MLDGDYRSIADDVVLGRDVRLARFINLYGCVVGDETTIGAFVEIQRGARVGNRSKVSSHSFICEGVTIGDRCFIGHNVTFTNDLSPRATTADGRLQGPGDWTMTPTVVEDGASIGSAATILAGVRIGRDAMVGAGAVVTKDVPAGMLAVGVPARVAGPAPDRAGVGETSESVPFLDLARAHEPIRAGVLADWSEILDASAFVGGRRVETFEDAFAAAHDTAHAVAVSSGTAALELIVRALGIGSGDAVIVPASTFIATAAAVTNAGAIPRFVDCDATGNIDVEQAIGAMDDPAVRAVVPVHLYGHPADLDPILAAAAARTIHVVEDAAQAHLATYRGRPVGGHGIAAAFSFYPGKNLGAPGEGGAITTNDAALAARLRMLRDHGQSAKYRSELVGTNARMMELVAAMLLRKLERLEAATASRRRVAAMYEELLGGNEHIELPRRMPWADPVYHLYVVQVDQRDRVQRLLADGGVETGLHYPVPLHLQPAYSRLGHGAGSFPVAERRAGRLLSLPMFPELTDGEVERVAKALLEAVDEAAGGP